MVWADDWRSLSFSLFLQLGSRPEPCHPPSACGLFQHRLRQSMLAIHIYTVPKKQSNTFCKRGGVWQACDSNSKLGFMRVIQVFSAISVLLSLVALVFVSGSRPSRRVLCLPNPIYVPVLWDAWVCGRCSDILKSNLPTETQKKGPPSSEVQYSKSYGRLGHHRRAGLRLPPWRSDQ